MISKPFHLLAISLFISLNLTVYTFAKTIDGLDNGGKKLLPFDYKIGAADVLEISVYEELDLCKTIRVSESGTITYPLIGRIGVLGLTVVQVEEKLTDLLAKDYLVNPQVNVFVKEYSKFYVYGEVEKVGAYPIYGKMSVLEAITTAGGFTKIANKGKVRIIRKKEGKEEVLYVNVERITKEGQEENATIVCPNDVIIVPESFF